METHGPLGTLWVGLGLCAFYIALVWINTLLGFVLTPLFIVPATWLQDKVMGKTRGTIWEIHPVTKIEVYQGGRWIDLDTVGESGEFGESGETRG